MKKLLLLLTATVLLASCGGVLEKKVNTASAKEDLQKIREKHSDKYTEEDVAIAADDIAGEFMRKMLGEGVTVGEEIRLKLDKTYKSFLDEAQAGRFAHEKEMKVYTDQIENLNKALQIKVLNVKLENMDNYGYSKKLVIDIKITNSGTKDIKGFEYRIRVLDMFDNEMNAFRIPHTTEVKAGITETTDYALDASYDYKIQSVGDASMSGLKFVYEPISIVYTDGTKDVAPIKPITK